MTGVQHELAVAQPDDDVGDADDRIGPVTRHGERRVGQCHRGGSHRVAERVGLDQPVVRPSRYDVVAAAAADRVKARAADDRVVARPAKDDVLAAAAANRRVPRAAVDRVVRPMTCQK